MANAVHLTPLDLADYFRGSASDSLAETIEAHWAACDECLRLSSDVRFALQCIDRLGPRMAIELEYALAVAVAFERSTKRWPQLTERLRQWLDRFVPAWPTSDAPGFAMRFDSTPELVVASASVTPQAPNTLVSTPRKANIQVTSSGFDREHLVLLADLNCKRQPQIAMVGPNDPIARFRVSPGAYVAAAESLARDAQVQFER